MNWINELYTKTRAMTELVRETEGKENGEYGEKLTNDYLQQSLKGNFKIVRNIYLPIGNKVTEIDCVIVHEKGIFVLESKNYGGWIFGSVKDEQWCQTFPTGHKYKFYNPIKQNNTHCDAICNALKINRDIVKSYIVFSERCELKKVPQDNGNVIIIKREYLIDTLNDEISVRNSIFNQQEILNVFNCLNTFNNEEYKTIHKKQVLMYKEGNICPKCGKKLVIRNGAYNKDDFIGCSGFPNCRFTRSITDKDLKLFGVEWDIQLFVGKNRIM